MRVAVENTETNVNHQIHPKILLHFSELRSDDISGSIWPPNRSPSTRYFLDYWLRRGNDVRHIFFNFSYDFKPKRFRRNYPSGSAQCRVYNLSFLPSGKIWRPVHMVLVAGLLIVALLRERPSYIYASRGYILHLFVIAWISKIIKGPKVVVRLLGLPPQWKQRLVAKGAPGIFYRLLWRAPFHAISCTKDGSSAAVWMSRFAAPATRIGDFLNPSDCTMKKEESVKSQSRFGPLKLAVAGRVAPGKNVEVICNSVIKSINQGITASCDIYGDGEIYDKCKRDFFNYLGKELDFHGFTEKKFICEKLQEADAYISLNTVGQLSNANLDAYYSGIPLILWASKAEVFHEASDFYPPEGIFWLHSQALEDVELELTELLVSLWQKPERLRRAKNAIRGSITHNRQSWEDRLSAEYRLIVTR